MSHLAIRDLSIEYRMKKTQQRLVAVHGVSLDVGAGRFVAIVGPSGCGKTSILNAVCGLVPPASGRILVDGRPVSGPGAACGMVFQSPALMPWRTVLRNVTYGLELRRVDAVAARAAGEHFVDLVGLRGFEHSFPGELSGGMQQRVNLARALAVRPQVLLFDEPLSSLDALTREQMQLELQRIWLETGVTAVYITHQISEALFLADEIVVMTGRPGTIRAILPVPAPRPRTLKMRREPGMLVLEDRIRALLRSEESDGDGRGERWPDDLGRDA